MDHQPAVFDNKTDEQMRGKASVGPETRRVVVQTETTGLGPGHRVIEIGCVEMLGRRVTGRTYHCYVNAQRAIDAGAIMVHGISEEFIADAPKFEEIVAEFVDFVRNAELIIHNTAFDITYLNVELKRLKLPAMEKVTASIVDTLKMARAIRPNQKNSIDVLCAEYHLNNFNQQYYGALLDAARVAGIYLAMTRGQQEFSTLSLLEQIEACWSKDQDKGYLGHKWANELVAGQEKLLDDASQFHQWAPLKIYLSVSKATSSRGEFSIRYQGQHVGSLLVKNDTPLLRVDAKTAETNKRYFSPEADGSCFGIGQAGIHPWRNPAAAEFRKHFKHLKTGMRPHSDEHRIEAIFLEQMADSSKRKFNDTLKNIQPVLLAGCPFQMPVPISGNTGVPTATKGNIDIVARRRVGNRTRISIWELKRPGVTVNAAEQAYIYAVTLLKMLREKESGHIWYKDIFGFGGKIPDRLTIECVVAVSLEGRKKEKFSAQLRRFVAENSFKVGSDSIEFYMANYTEERGSLSIEFEKVGRQDFPVDR